MLSEKKILNKTKKHNPPLQVKWSVPHVDFAKTFDSVDHALLFAKLLSIGIGGKIYNIIKKMYRNLQSCVRIDDMVTDWFTIDGGVRQEDSLDPLLFAIFINDLAIDINNLNLGIETGIE